MEGLTVGPPPPCAQSDAQQKVRRQANIVAVEKTQLYELPMEDAWDVMRLSSNMMASLKDINNLRRRNMFSHQTFDSADGQEKQGRPVGGGASPASTGGYLSRVASDYSETTQASDTHVSSEEDSSSYQFSETVPTFSRQSSERFSQQGSESPAGSLREYR
jgi:hypothetical protein